LMRLRIAAKILKAVRRGPTAYSRQQVARACLRVFRSPLLITAQNAEWTSRTSVPHLPGHGRAMLVSSRCMIVEQRSGLFDVVRRGERRYFESRR
jgi:hypothetical protein